MISPYIRLLFVLTDEHPRKNFIAKLQRPIQTIRLQTFRGCSFISSNHTPILSFTTVVAKCGSYTNNKKIVVAIKSVCWRLTPKIPMWLHFQHHFIFVLSCFPQIVPFCAVLFFVMFLLILSKTAKSRRTSLENDLSNCVVCKFTIYFFTFEASRISRH